MSLMCIPWRKASWDSDPKEVALLPIKRKNMSTTSNTDQSKQTNVSTTSSGQAANKPIAVYTSFDSYPWVKDPVFQAMLSRALRKDDGSEAALDVLDCRIARYREQIGVGIDALEYLLYRSAGNRPEVKLVPEDILELERTHVPEFSKRKYAALHEPNNGLVPIIPQVSPEASQRVSVPAWQQLAPKGDLYVDKSEGAAACTSGKEPYPKQFEAIIEHLQSGKEIPGIKQIPDTVIDIPPSSTSGRPAPRKPWQRD